MTTWSAALLLFLVLDPFGNVPFFISALRRVPEARRQRIIVRELVIALFVMIAFLFGGRWFLGALRISPSALTVAGGTVLFLIALKMIFPPSGGSAADDISGEPFVFPLAVPYVAGPSALASLLLIMNREPARWPEWLLALLLAWFGAGIIIMLSGSLARVLGERVLMAIERLMGMVLVAIAMQMVMSGIAEFARGV